MKLINKQGVVPILLILGALIVLSAITFFVFGDKLLSLYYGHRPVNEKNPQAIEEYTSEKNKLGFQLPSYWGVCVTDEPSSFGLGQIIYVIGYPQQEIVCRPGKETKNTAYTILITRGEGLGGKDIDLQGLNEHLMKLYSKANLKYELEKEPTLMIYSGKPAGRIDYSFSDKSGSFTKKTVVKLDSGKDLYFVIVDYPGEWWDKFDTFPQEVHHKEIESMLNNLRFL